MSLAGGITIARKLRLHGLSSVARCHSLFSDLGEVGETTIVCAARTLPALSPFPPYLFFLSLRNLNFAPQIRSSHSSPDSLSFTSFPDVSVHAEYYDYSFTRTLFPPRGPRFVGLLADNLSTMNRVLTIRRSGPNVYLVFAARARTLLRHIF